MRAALLLICCVLPATAQDAPTPFVREKVRVLLREQLPCLGCHEFEGEGGRIGPSLSDVGRRRDAAYIRAMIEAPRRTAPRAAMPLTPMPAATREALIRVLATGARSGTTPPPGGAGAAPASARDVYARWCAACHGAAGRGDGPNAPFLPVPPANHASAAMGERADDALYDVIAAGGLPMGKSARMPAFGATLSDSEIRDLVRYIRTLCACAAPGWSRDPESR